MKKVKGIKTTASRRFFDRIFGGFPMNPLTVALFTVVSALITALFLTAPIFRDSSFYQIGERLLIQILLAVIITANCRKPLEAALKVFVFFAAGLTLSCLFLVPFSDLGWRAFPAHKVWLFAALLSFPAAFIGWYIHKKNLLAVLILSPILVYLAVMAYHGFYSAFTSFPRLLIFALFCVFQISVYVYAFFPKLPHRALGASVAILAAVISAIVFSPEKKIVEHYESLPNGIAFGESAGISVADPTVAKIVFANPVVGTVRIDAEDYGKTEFTVTDQGKEYVFLLEYCYDFGSGAFRITALDKDRSGNN